MKVNYEGKLTVNTVKAFLLFFCADAKQSLLTLFLCLYSVVVTKNQQVHCHSRQNFKCAKKGFSFYWYKTYKVLVLMLQSRDRAILVCFFF